MAPSKPLPGAPSLKGTSPENWRDFLIYRLAERWQTGLLSPSGLYRSRPWREISDYYEGHHPLQFATPKFLEAFGELFAEFADNWCPTMVEAPVERLNVHGFRFGTEGDADMDAWQIWQENGLDAEIVNVHTTAIELGEAYWLVDPTGDGQLPRITAEHPGQCIVFHEPGDPMRRLAALKTFLATDGRGMCTLWLPDTIYRWESSFAAMTTVVELPWSAQRKAGEWSQAVEKAPEEPNTLGVVPMIPIRNRPHMLIGGRSDLEPVLGLQDAINKLCSDTLVGSEFTAWPQRILTGVQWPKDPQTGQPVSKESLEAGVSRVLMFAGPNARAQEWAQADPARLVSLIEMFVQHSAAQSRTPPHYLLVQMANMSSDALKTAETGLVARTRAKMPYFGESHEELIRVSFLAMGDSERAGRKDAETMWGDPEYRTEAERFDAAIKSLAIGLPKKVVWERLGMSPVEIARAEAIAAQEELLNPGGLSQQGAAEMLTARAQQVAQQSAGQPKAVAQPSKVPGSRPSLPGTLSEPDPFLHVAPITIRA
jgi:Phage portal protein, SPP1 Gp6-like